MKQDPTCPALNEYEWKIYKELTTPNVFVSSAERSNLSWKDMGLVTFVSKTHLQEAIVNCASIREHPQLNLLKLNTFFSFDINDTHLLQYQKVCPHAQILMFPFEKFPNSVRKMEHYKFKALHEALALKDNKVLLSFDTSILFHSQIDFTALIESNIKDNPTDVTLLTAANHTMFSTVHPKMYHCFSNIKPEMMVDVPQFQSGLILWIGSEMGWKTMTRFVECSLQSNCIAPHGATKKCNIRRIFKYPRMYSGCHRFDQAALNLILYETSNQKSHLYGKQINAFRVARKYYENAV